MACSRWAKWALLIFTLFFLSVSFLEAEAMARFSGGRSFGNRGSRSYSLPRSPAPGPVSPSRQYAPQRQSPSGQPQSPPTGGGFLRGLAGGVVGGLLGGMLFRSLGFGGPGMGGGIGLFDIILIGLILYGIWWFIKRRRQREAVTTAGYSSYEGLQEPEPYRSPSSYEPTYDAPPAEDELEVGLGHIRRMDPDFDPQHFKDQCLDTFFRLQAAWGKRDMSDVSDLLTAEMQRIMQGQADELRAAKRINRLENIAVRAIDIVEAWQEEGQDFITVRFYANLLDYTVDELTGQVVAGSATEPVKFEEYWTFTRPVGGGRWKLSAVTQAS